MELEPHDLEWEMVSSSEDGGGGDSEEGAANRAAEEAALAASFLAAEPDAVAGSPPSVRLRVLAASPEGSLSSLGSHTAAAAASAAELDAPQLPGSPHASSGRGRAAAGTSAAAPAPQPARRCDSVHLCVVRSDDQEALQQELALSRSREASALTEAHRMRKLLMTACSVLAFLFLKSLVGGLHGCRASAGAGPCTAGAASRTRAAAHGTFEPPLGLSAADAELLSSVAIQVEPLAAALLL